MEKKYIDTFLGEEVPHVKYINSIFLLKVIYHTFKVTRRFFLFHSIMLFLVVEKLKIRLSETKKK